MATRNLATPLTNSTDANFRAWINEIHNALIAFGWVQTADTGQINFATVTRPVATNTYQGFATYRMNDSLQGTCAVYMRLDFGTASSNADAPGIKVQLTIGGTNGSGTLTGNVGTQQNPWAGGPNAANDTIRTSGTTSRFGFYWGRDNDNNFGFWIERDLDTSGNETSLGVNLLILKDKTTGMCQFLENAGGTGIVENKWLSMISSQASQSGGGNVGVGPCRVPFGPMRNPCKVVGLFSKGDFTAMTTGPITIYGASHTYMMCYPASAISTLHANNGSPGIAMLWE